MSELYDVGHGINRTKLAGKSGLNYGTCMSYLDFLARLKWISIIPEHGAQIVLTETGREYVHILSQSENENNSFRMISNSTHQLTEQTTVNGRNLQRSDNDTITGYVSNDRNFFRAGTIMLVDDDKDILLTYKIFFAEYGFDVHAFVDPEVAIRAFKDEPCRFDLVLLDIRMERINGLQVYYEMKSINPDLKVIFVTGLDAAPEVISVLPGFRKEDIFSKPVDLDKLAVKCRMVVLEGRRKQHLTK